MIWLDSTYDFGWNEPLFGKIGARVLNLWLDTSFGSKWPKCSSLAPDLKFRKSLRFHNFSGFILWFWRNSASKNKKGADLDSCHKPIIVVFHLFFLVHLFYFILFIYLYVCILFIYYFYFVFSWFSLKHMIGYPQSGTTAGNCTHCSKSHSEEIKYTADNSLSIREAR